MYIKVVKKDMCGVNKNIRYELDKVYERAEQDKAFHIYVNLHNTLDYNSPANCRYFEAEALSSIIDDDPYCQTDKIKLIRELVYEQLIAVDETGRWCYRYACTVEGADLPRLQNEVVNKDKTGEWCFRFALNVKDANIVQLQQAVIEKYRIEKTGEWLMKFSKNISGADKEKLRYL